MGDGLAEVLVAVYQLHALDEILDLVGQELAHVAVGHNLDAVGKLVVAELAPHVHDEILAVVHTVHMLVVHEQHAALVETIDGHLLAVNIHIHLLVACTHTLVAEKLHQRGGGGIKTGTGKIIEQQLIHVLV